MNIPETDLRLVTGDIGGSFGLRGSLYPEMILLIAWAARRVGRPVRWIAATAPRASWPTTTRATT